MTVRLASCSCGQLQAEIRGDPIDVAVCHCYACRRRTGSVFSAQAGFPRESVTIKGNGTDFVRVGDEGARFMFTFCPKCRSTVFFVEEGHEQQIAIPVGAFADSHFPAPTVSVYEERGHSWVSLPDNVEHWRKDPVQARTIGQREYANALAGKVTEAASYAACASVYAAGGYAAVPDRLAAEVHAVTQPDAA